MNSKKGCAHIDSSAIINIISNMHAKHIDHTIILYSGKIDIKYIE